MIDVAKKILCCQQLIGLTIVVVSWLALAGSARTAYGFIPRQRWSTTASDTAGSQGDPIALTWSLVPDGTPIPGVGTSGLLAFLDDTYGSGAGDADLTRRPWFPLIEMSLNRWSELSGVQFQFEPQDDGVAHSQFDGQLGVRGDIRFAGASIDGFNNTLALSSFPNNADILLDTDDRPQFSNPDSNYRRLRNVLMHELGHSLGFEHVESNNAAFLMEPNLSTAFDGPQLDDIRAVQWYYGDVLERSNDGQGNNSPQYATDLGLIAGSSTVAVGADAGPDLVVAAADQDFVSIHNGQDRDFFLMRVAQPSVLDAMLAPRGGVYNQGSPGGQQTQFDANFRSDLALAIFDTDGTTLLALVNRDGAGATETVNNLVLPSAGEYFIRVTGASAQVQLYQLDISISAVAITLAGDYSRDGTVDAADYSVWRDSLGEQGTLLAADGNGDEVVDQLDYGIWKSNFGAGGGGSAVVARHAIPEPSPLIPACIAASTGISMWRRRPQRAR